MFDSNDFLIAIKRAALDAVKSQHPVSICFGNVTSVSPLKITVEQKLTLGKAQLILTRNVTDYKINMTANWSYETGKKEITVHNALKIGDEVILIKQQGGQKYLVLDRVVKE
ncbi:MAG: DUF2577 domain-containing protein [Lachnospiraceae bacterium]|nr:DUF2577 domain-containing protein [Lachnospiraceae bacterium]